ncbi:MAG: Eco57I restriction-modification methylase domain-containing protein [Gemmataceae bacterium]
MMLVCRFIRDRQSAALQYPAIDAAGTTPYGFCQALQQAVGSPVLQAVLDPADCDNSNPLSQSIWRALLTADLGWRDRLGRIVPLPPTAFGEFHQLCLSERDAGESGQRRARGVHYTPVSVADYLTVRVLDRLLAPQDVGMPLRILDPSCGGGTFLLAALRYLLQQRGNPCPQETLELLGASLFGSDIDPQAIVATRRALLLAVWDALRASGNEALDGGLRVPDLRQNIVCQDFLASSDSLSQFHAILGGPPFVRIHEMLRIDPDRVEQYRTKYRTAQSGQFDLFMPFFEEAIHRLAEGGWLGWSVASTFLRTSSGRPLRSLLGGSCAVHELTEFEDSKVYPDAVTQIVLVLLEKGRRQVSCRHAWITGTGGLRDKLTTLWSGGDHHPNVIVRELPTSACLSGDWSFGSATERSLLDRIQDAGTPLGRLPISICQSLVTGADPVFLFRRGGSTEDGQTLVQGRDQSYAVFVESVLLRPVVRNRDIKGYGRLSSRTVCLTPYDRSGRLLPESVLRDSHPLAYQYLLKHRETLVRRRGIRPHEWYALRSPSCLTLAAGPRVLLKLICSGGDFTMDQEGRYLGHAGTLMLAADQQRVDLFYLLGVLNTQVFWFFVRQTMPTMGHGRHVLRRSTLRRFPLVVSDPSRELRQQIADAARGLLADGVTKAAQSRLLEQIERQVAELYGIDPSELSASAPDDEGDRHARPS